MLSKNNQVLARHAKADHQQRWALRKLTVGVASVLLGGILLVVNGTPVAADQVNPENATAVKSEPEMSNTKQDAENAVTLASTASHLPAINATSSEQSPAGEGVEAILATSAASPAPSDPSVTAPPQPATLASGAPGQMQPAVTKQQAPEMGWRKMEDGDQLVTYYVIVREVTLVKPDGEEVVMPLLPLRKGQVWDTLDYLDEEENDNLPLIHFDPIEVDPIAGAKAPVIPAISQSVHSFLTTDLDKIEISYVTPPVQRIGMVEVTALPGEPEYDEIYDKIYDQYEDNDTKYEKEIKTAGRRYAGLEVLLLKETYQYLWAEEKTITRTINVHLPNGEVQTTKQPVTLTRTYTKVNGQTKYSEWTTGTWDSFTAPEQTGYTALPGSVAEVEVTSESLDAVVDIYYRADEPAVVEGKEEKTITRTINVHLPNGEVQTTKQPVTLERKYTSVAGSGEKKYGPWTAGRWESFTAPEQEGYTALPGSVAEVEVTSESLDAVVDIYYRADEAVIESGQEEKTITRTINVHLPNGEVQTTTQPVTLVREYTGVAGSDEKNYGPWNTGQWNAFTAPELAGYTAMPGSVASVEVTSESLDVVVDIYYRIDIPPKVEVGPDPEQPTTDPDPEQPTTDPDPEQPIGHPVAPATVAPDQQANLPQTGNATSSLVALLGATLATFLGSLLLLGKSKR